MTTRPDGAALPPAVGPRTRIGDFVVEGMLGRGGMAEVHRASQQRLGRSVALKVLTGPLASDPAVVARFAREAITMRDLEHPSIVPVYDVGEQDGRHYLAMRLLEGGTLRDLLAARRPSPAEVLRLLGPLAEALDHAHSRGVVHRDIKPANVLLDAAGRPYLADFGLAKALDATSVTISGSFLGTPRYMAPEQSSGASHRSDLYSFGCMAYEMLTGAPPFTASEAVALLYAHAHGQVPSVREHDPALPAGLDAVFARALAKAPTDRFGSAAEFVSALAVALGFGDAPTDRRALPAANGGPRAPWPRAWPVLAAAVAVVAVLAAVLAIVQPWAPADQAAAGDAPPPAQAEAPPPTLSPPPVPPAAATPPGATGPLLYEAAMDGTGAGFLDSPGTDLNPDKETLEHVPGAMRLTALTQGSYTWAQLDIGEGFTTYLAELDVAVRPQSAVTLCWSLRWAEPRELAWYWCLATERQTAEFRVFRGGQFTTIGAPVPVPGLQTGRTVRVHLTVGERRLAMHLDGALATEVDDDQVPVDRTIPGIELSSRRGTGQVEVRALRVWALPDVTGGE